MFLGNMIAIVLTTVLASAVIAAVVSALSPCLRRRDRSRRKMSFKRERSGGIKFVCLLRRSTRHWFPSASGKAQRSAGSLDPSYQPARRNG